jgi:hypothetical protein
MTLEENIKLTCGGLGKEHKKESHQGDPNA